MDAWSIDIVAQQNADIPFPLNLLTPLSEASVITRFLSALQGLGSNSRRRRHTVDELATTLHYFPTNHAEVLATSTCNWSRKVQRCVHSWGGSCYRTK